MESVTSLFRTESNPKSLPSETRRSSNSAHREKRNSGIEGKSTATSGIGSLYRSSMESTGSPSLQQMMTDTLVEKIIKTALPPSSLAAKDTIATRMARGKNRPQLSVPLTTKNVIAMNARLGVPFMIIDEIINFINWENVPFNICVMLIYAFTIMKPITMISCGPIFYLLFGIMIPQYLYVHSPNPLDPETTVVENRTPAQGPPIRKPILPDPVPEFSQEFILNLTDLQNHMLIYIVGFNFITSILKQFAYFVNEQKSTMSFVILLFVAIFNFFFLESIWFLIPIRFILIVMGWIFMVILHPSLRDHFFNMVTSEDTRINWIKFTKRYEDEIMDSLRIVEAREMKMVSVYEIQLYKDDAKEWRTQGYSTDDYSLFSPLRINEIPLEQDCCETIDQVEPPLEWEWVPESTWIIDLDAKQWVQEGFVQYVKIDSKTKWVYDVDIDGSLGCYRRRVWTNMVQRKTYKGNKYDNDTSENVPDSASMSGNHVDQEGHVSYSEVEVVNPLREGTYSHDMLHGVSRRSLAGGQILPTSSVTATSISADDSMNILNTSI